MFLLNCFIDISNGRPGMLVPLLSSPDTNLPYVQQMDEYFVVREVVPFLEYENYPVAPNEGYGASVMVGSYGLIAFRSPDGFIFCGTVEELLDYVDQNRTLVASDVLLRSQLNRIEWLGLDHALRGWESVASAKFDDEQQRSLWRDSEHRLHQKQKQIWDHIDGGKVDPKESATPGLERSLSEYSAEQLLRWLSIRSNYFTKGWTAVWHHLNVRLPFDDRVSLLGMQWMYALNEEDTDFQGSKSILFALFFRSRNSKDSNWAELAEFTLERLIVEPYLIYQFLRPKQFLPSLFVFLASFGSVDYVLRVIDYCIRYVPKDDNVVAGMDAALEVILREVSRDDSWDKPRRELSAAEEQAAVALRRELEALPNRPDA